MWLDLANTFGSVITGCITSVILFTLTINMVVKTTESECKGHLTKSGIRQPPIGPLWMTRLSLQHRFQAAGGFFKA